MNPNHLRWIIMTLGIFLLFACSGSEPDSEIVADTEERVALLFVGHGEPAVCEDGDVPITLADGTPFGPHAVELGVPENYQYTEWAAAYEEIATAMTYLKDPGFDPDLNNNGIIHEVKIFPEGDVPSFFTWDAFRTSICEHYQAVNNYSPHNDSIRAHVNQLDIQVDGAIIDTYIAYLDAVPRIPDIMWEIRQSNEYQKVVLVPMLLADSTHTQEVVDQVHESVQVTGAAALNTGDMAVVISEPFFEVPYVQQRMKNAVTAMAEYVRQSIPADVADEKIGVVLASHGTPYVPPLPEFGWQEGEIYSYLHLTEDIFHHEIGQVLPWKCLSGRMKYASPTIEDSLSIFETDEYTHVMVIPSAFPTAAMHTMWDVAEAAVGEAVVPEDGVVEHTRASGMKVYYSAQGYADIEPGGSEFRAGLAFLAKIGVMEVLEKDPGSGGEPPVPDRICEAGEICVTVTGGETTGDELRLMLYEISDEKWPQDFRLLPTPSWVVTQGTEIPANFPIHIRIPLEGNLFSFSNQALEDGTQLGLAVVTGAVATFTVNPDDARGFSIKTIEYQSGMAMDYGNVFLYVPQGTCELNPYHPSCLTGKLFWKEHFLGEENFVPGAVYMDTADLNEDGILDIVTVGEPHFEFPDMPLTELKLGVYYLNRDFTVKSSEIIDQWSEADPAFYSPWSVKVIEHAGEPMIIVGTNIPGLAPLEEGAGNVYSYRKVGGVWVRSAVRENSNPTVENYNAMIVVPCDIDNDGDTDLAMSGAFDTSAVGIWMENTGVVDNPWIEHFDQSAQTDFDTNLYSMRGTLAYKCTDLNGDNYPEVIYNAMFDITGSVPPRYHGEIWLAVNPGKDKLADPWQKIVIDNDNWASADMWFHDLDADGYKDLVANQIFNSTVTLYKHPGSNLADPWVPRTIISDLTSPSDMWLADIDNDGLVDVVSADHTAHRGVWHKNPGPGTSDLWQSRLIYRNIRMPGDFAMIKFDNDDDLDWLGTSMTQGRAYIVEQVQPKTSLVATISLSDSFSGNTRSFMLTLSETMPPAGPPIPLAIINNIDKDGDGELDVDQILSASKDLVLAIEDVGVTGDYHVVAGLYVEGGGQYEPLPGVDYMAATEKLTLGAGQVSIELELALVPAAP